MGSSVGTVASTTLSETTGAAGGPFLVRIELLRVQTFLFAVPRLRHMVGANVLLGEVLRLGLTALAVRCGASAGADAGQWLARFPEARKGSDSDPLASARRLNDQDDPRRIAGRGIVVRDGGHFAALFAAEPQALRFQEAAEALIQRKLPGLMFEVSYTDLGAAPEPNPEAKVPRKGRRARPVVLADLPVFEVCRDTGRGPAARLDNSRPKGEPPVPSSLIALGLKQRGNAFFGQDRTQDARARTRDIIGLLGDCLPCQGLPPPVDLNDLCGPDASGRRDYLAVIHADGNRVGLRYAQHRTGYPGGAGDGAGGEGDPVDPAHRGRAAALDHLCREGFGEGFYHAMRVAVRRAVVGALKGTFDGFCGRYRPFQLLMLGGDDLLLLCRARCALPFLVAYARGLQGDRLAGGDPLSIGAGVVIARPSVPFHRLHALAEDLAGSAKRLDRASGADGPGVSVVDWMVFSESWADEVGSVRQREAQVCYRRADGSEEWLALTGRPYRILRPEQGEADSLEALLADADKLAGAARSQLRQIALDLRKGRRWAELRWHELPKETRSAFERAGMHTPWQSLGQRSLNGRMASGYVTRLADLVELSEFNYLGRADPKPTRTAPAGGEMADG